MKKEPQVQIDDELIVHYLSGEATPEEAIALTDWLKMPANKQHFNVLESIWLHSAQSKKPVFNSREAWNKLFRKSESSEKSMSKRFLGLTNRTLRIAASLLAVTICGVWLSVRLNTGEKQTSVITTTQSKKITLADHSVVTLYRQSALIHPIEFENDSRKISLTKGEAFFEVAPDKLKPFIVQAHETNIKVVGTKFNVALLDSHIKISVAEGTVLVYNSYDSALVTAGFTVVVNPSDKKIVSLVTENDNDWGYATQKLVFKNTPLPSVIQVIEKTYPCSIKLANKDIEMCRLTVTFDGDSIEKIVNLTAEVLNLTVKKHEEVFILEGQGCQ